jgi:FixJ family two-component response regulator
MDRPGEIDAIRRNVFAAERQAVRQRQIVAGLRKTDKNTSLAEHILEVFETTLAAHRAHLAKATDERSAADVP